MVRRPAELIVTLCLIGVALVAFISSFSVSGGINAASVDSPMRLPRILLGIWAVLGVGCAIRVMLPGGSNEDGSIQPPRVLVAGAVLLAIGVALPFLGYLLTIGVGLAVLLWLLGERHPVRFAAAFLLLGPGLWALFHHLLGLRLPLLISGGVF